MSSHQRKREPLLVWATDLLTQWWTIVNILLGLGLSLWNLFASSHGIDLTTKTWISAALVVAIGILAWFGKLGEINIKSLKSSLESCQLENEKILADFEVLVSSAKDIVFGVLYDLGNGALEFGKNGKCNERISIYLHRDNEQFIRVSRYSKNPDLDSKGRAYYSSKEKCIGDAWRNGCSYHQLPDYNKNSRQWLAEMKKMGVDKTIAVKFVMKSSLYCGLSLKNNHSALPIGVILVESTDRNRFDMDTLQNILSADIRSTIARLLEVVDPRLGILSDATKEGL